MKWCRPDYYDQFRCIAGACKDSCCIGWEIDIDEKTDEKYAAVGGEIGEVIRSSIDRSETPHFALCAGERCPHLLGNGLCNIIKVLGEGYLCDICREHPRFYNDTVRGVEVGLGMACEEACRLILSSDGYRDIVEVGETDGADEEFLFDPVEEREYVYSILGDRSVPYPERLKRMAGEYGISLSRVSKEKIASLSYIQDRLAKMGLK